MHIGVGRKSKPAGSAPFSIQLNEIAGDVLDLALGLCFEFVPGVAAQPVQNRCCSLFADIFRDTVQRMDTYIKHVFVFIYQADGFLLLSIIHDLFKPVEPPNPMVDMGHIIARF